MKEYWLNNILVVLAAFSISLLLNALSCKDEPEIPAEGKDSATIDSDYYHTFGDCYDYGDFYFIGKDTISTQKQDVINILQPIPVSFVDTPSDCSWFMYDRNNEVWKLITGYRQKLIFWEQFFVFEKLSDREHFLLSGYPIYYTSDLESATTNSSDSVKWFKVISQISLAISKPSFWKENCSCPALFNPIYWYGKDIEFENDITNIWNIHTYKIDTEDWNGEDCERREDCLRNATDDNGVDTELKHFQMTIPNWRASDSYSANDYFAWVGEEPNPDDPGDQPPPKCKIRGEVDLNILEIDSISLIPDEVIYTIRGDYNITIKLDEHYGACTKTQNGMFLGIQVQTKTQ